MSYRDDEAAAAAWSAANERHLRSALPEFVELAPARPCLRWKGWDEMPGEERVRECGACRQKVFELRGLSRPKVAELLDCHGAALHGRLLRRADGTILTGDCVTAFRRRQWWRALPWVVAAVAALAVVALIAIRVSWTPTDRRSSMDEWFCSVVTAHYGRDADAGEWVRSTVGRCITRGL